MIVSHVFIQLYYLDWKSFLKLVFAFDYLHFCSASQTLFLCKLSFATLNCDARSMTHILVFIDGEPVSGQIFSEKRSKLLKIAAKTASMGSAELVQRRL